jgi:hypothetical protein
MQNTENHRITFEKKNHAADQKMEFRIFADSLSRFYRPGHKLLLLSLLLQNPSFCNLKTML